MGCEAAIAECSALVEALPLAAAGLDSRCAVHFSNSAADGLLRRADGMRIKLGRVVLSCSVAQAQLERVLQDHASMGGSHERIVAVVPRPSGAEPWLLAASPIHPASSSGATSLLCIVDLDHCATVPPPLLQSLYGLTPAEARLAAQLGTGADLAGLSQWLRVQPDTARSQLKTIFRKMGLRRQQELVRVLTTIGTVIPLESRGISYMHTPDGGCATLNNS